MKTIIRIIARMFEILGRPNSQHDDPTTWLD